MQKNLTRGGVETVLKNRDNKCDNEKKKQYSPDEKVISTNVKVLTLE